MMYVSFIKGCIISKTNAHSNLPSGQVCPGHGGKLQSSNGLRRYTCPVGQTLTSNVHGGGGLHCASVKPAAWARHRLTYGHSFDPHICGSYLQGLVIGMMGGKATCVRQKVKVRGILSQSYII